MSGRIPVYQIVKTSKEDSGGFFKILQIKGSPEKDPLVEYAPYETNARHRHNFFEICLFTDGAGIHEIDFISHSIKPESIHIVVPGQIHYLQKAKDTNGYIIAFNREFHSMFFLDNEANNTALPNNFIGSKSIINLSNQAYQDFLNIVKQMIRESQQNGKHSQQILNYYLHIFILKLGEFVQETIISETSKDNRYQLVNRFKKAVESNYKKAHLVKDYADLLDTDPIRLNKVCKKLTLKTAGEIITERIILEAKRQLAFSSLTNKEIAHFLNFEDPSYFSRVFRKKTGLTPTDFRNSMAKKYQNFV
ncbi:MAG: AraC family transcriptional regulator [Thalassobius sp.]|nr:AraC family transcriptional regulator [Thalassovita sp.]